MFDLQRMKKALEGPTFTIPQGLTETEIINYIQSKGTKQMMTNEQVQAFRELQASIHEGNVKAGWWTDLSSGIDLAEECRKGTRFGKALVAEKLCLVHSEASESMEGARKDLMDDKLPHRKMIEVELADVVIRVKDLAGALELDLAGAIQEKLAYNAVREDHKVENRVKEGGKAY